MPWRNDVMMTKDEAKAAVERMLGAFPQMTPEQVRYWKDQCAKREKWTAAAFEVAFDKYVSRGKPYIETTLLHQLILNELAEANRVELEARANQQRNEQAIAAEWAEIDRVIDAMSDEELATAKREVLDGTYLEPAAKAMLANLDPRKSATLKGMIYQARRLSHA